MAVSPLWTETPDESGRGPDYLNTVALLETGGDDPRALLEALLRAELGLGRDRAQGRNAPRTLDLDWWRWRAGRAPGPGRRRRTLQVLGPELTLELPHPGPGRRPFVMDPARALGPGFFV